MVKLTAHREQLTDFFRFCFEKLTWYKNNEPLMASQRVDFDYNLSTYISTLNIKVTKRVDVGEYRVEAENIAGKCQTSCKLFILEVPNIDETAYVNPDSFRQLEFAPRPADGDDDDNKNLEPVLIVKPLEDQECFEGETVSFICEVKGTPKPVVSFESNWPSKSLK